jgi:predicted amidophosphoribosyltransferase
VTPDDVQIRADLCAACATPCAFRDDTLAHANPCATCPRQPPVWSKYDCATATAPALGDLIAAQLARHAPDLVAAVGQCGGCTHAKHALGSTTAHPDPGIVL